MQAEYEIMREYQDMSKKGRESCLYKNKITNNFTDNLCKPSAKTREYNTCAY